MDSGEIAELNRYPKCRVIEVNEHDYGSGHQRTGYRLKLVSLVYRALYNLLPIFTPQIWKLSAPPSVLYNPLRDYVELGAATLVPATHFHCVPIVSVVFSYPEISSSPSKTEGKETKRGACRGAR